MLRILDITAPDINNGTGIRVTLWVSGCTHKCKGCHNSWTWNYNQGKIFMEDQDEILHKLADWLSRDYVDGITFSGGDPLDQNNDNLCELYNIIKWVRNNFPKKTIWLYTGYTKEEIDESDNYMRKKVVDSIDVLVDGPYKEELRDIAHCPFRGSTNQRIICIKNNENIKK